ncbi:uncharacterized protein ACNLHF_003479 [Anomaloglossus baeobatrachus]
MAGATTNETEVIYRRPQIMDTMPPDERQTFQDLLDLLEENTDGPVVPFLDLEISIEDNGVSTNLYRKSTATNALLHFSSFHPQHVRAGLLIAVTPRKQYLRHIKGSKVRHRSLSSVPNPNIRTTMSDSSPPTIMSGNRYTITT